MDGIVSIGEMANLFMVMIFHVENCVNNNLYVREDCNEIVQVEIMIYQEMVNAIYEIDNNFQITL